MAHETGYYTNLTPGPYLIDNRPFWMKKDIYTGAVEFVELSIQAEPIDALLWFLYSIKKPGFTMAEVGVWRGETLIHYAPMIKQMKGKVYAVDWFRGNKNFKLNSEDEKLIPDLRHSYKTNDEEINDAISKFRQNLQAVGVEDIVEVLHGDSVEMSEYIPDNSLDLCFIDADHTYSGVKRDIEAYLPKVKNGGYICGHDCLDIRLANTFTKEQLELPYLQLDDSNGCHPGVIQAVYDCLGEGVVTVPCSTIGIPIWIKQKGQQTTKLNLIERPRPRTQ